MAPLQRQGSSTADSKSSSGKSKQVSLFDFFSTKPKKKTTTTATTSSTSAKNAASLTSTKQNKSGNPSTSSSDKKKKTQMKKDGIVKEKSKSKSNGGSKGSEKKRCRAALEDTDNEEEEMELEWWEEEERNKGKKKRHIADDSCATEGEESEFEAPSDDEEEEYNIDEQHYEEEEEEDTTPVRTKVKTKKSTSSAISKPAPPSSRVAVVSTTKKKPRTDSANNNANNNKIAVASLAQYRRKLSLSPAPSTGDSASRISALLSMSQISTNSTTMMTTSPKTPTFSSLASVSTASSSSKSRTPTTTSASKGPPRPVKDAVNPAGSHHHNHLKFLNPPRDAQGRTPEHSDYDCRTLRVSQSDWKNVTGSAMTNASLQWWELKAQYFDTVLLFKTGKFYEMFHMDADVGVTVLGLSYMKGADAHAGFPEKAYGAKADRLVRAGYKVARVEQTETPDMLNERKKKCPSGKKPKVVNREVCSILTLGTRTCCYLDQYAEQNPQDVLSVGPLLVIAERPLRKDLEEGQPLVREFGITIVDAPRGWVTLGQFEDDALCGHLQTLLAAYTPSEILYQGSHDDKEKSFQQNLKSLFLSYRANSVEPCRVEVIRPVESFPKSNALDPKIKKRMERRSPTQPWNADETLGELQRQNYFSENVSGWPPLLEAVVKQPDVNGLALSSFGAALYYLQRNLIDAEILSLGVVHQFTCPTSTFLPNESQSFRSGMDFDIVEDNFQGEETDGNASVPVDPNRPSSSYSQLPGAQVDAMTLEGTTLHNLEVLASAHDNKVAGSLWAKINHTKTPHGARLLRAWLLRPLFLKGEIDRRADAVEELSSGAAALACRQARALLSKCGDIERLLKVVHTMKGSASVNSTVEDSAASVHPNERAVYFEAGEYTKRKVGDFAKLLHGLEYAIQIPGIFADVALRSPLLKKCVRLAGQEGGCFPDIESSLLWFKNNFDVELAAKGLFEPTQGIDECFDEANNAVSQIRLELENFKNEMCQALRARSSWKYANTEPNSKDKYLIELPASIQVPGSWEMKGKRGKGHKQVNKYVAPEVANLVADLEHSYEILNARRAKAVELVFAKFDAQREFWAAAAQASAILDALSSLAQLASQPGYTRPAILEYEDKPVLSFTQARHPTVDGEFIPNDLSLGSEDEPERVLLLSGPNMGGKSTLLRQTCLLAILSQIGSFVPAESCALTPLDRVFTRLGASDRILLGQSTFFVELSETSTALRGATDRSLVIMDELGRGTSTHDGHAVASAVVKSLVERNKCLALFATHYHSLLEDWSSNPKVRLGHMECLVENEGTDDTPSRVTFLYTLGRGSCPKSFGINVARLAGLPQEVMAKASKISREFEIDVQNGSLRCKLQEAIQSRNWEVVQALWEQLQS